MIFLTIYGMIFPFSGPVKGINITILLLFSNSAGAAGDVVKTVTVLLLLSLGNRTIIKDTTFARGPIGGRPK